MYMPLHCCLFIIISLATSCICYGQAEKKRLIDTLTYQTQSGLPVAASKIYFSNSRFAISGYGESSFIHYAGPKNTSSQDIELYFSNMQRFVLYGAYKPWDWLVIYTELFSEYISDGSRESYFELQPEFFLDFLFSKYFNLRIGTHQVQLGYINNNDEPILFYSVNRPEVERLILPSTWIDLGVKAYGKISESLRWTLSLYQGLDIESLNEATWIRRGRDKPTRFRFDGYTLNGSLKHKTDQSEIGLTGLYSTSGSGTSQSNIWLISPYIRRTYDQFSFMLLASYGQLSNPLGIYERTRPQDGLDGQVMGTQVYGYYLELGYNILPFFRRNPRQVSNFFYDSREVQLPLFVRYERLDTHASVPAVFQNKSYSRTNLHAITVGANYRPRRNIALKANYQFRRNLAPIQEDIFEGNRAEFGIGFIF